MIAASACAKARALFSLCLYLCTPTEANIGSLSIDRAIWTDTVDRATREYGLVYKSPVRTRKIYLWMRLKGTPELLEQLKAATDGRLPIRHRWSRYNSDGLRFDSDVVVDFNIGRRSDLQKLAYQLQHEGFFTWRVWSGKEHLSRGWWRVDVLWDSDEPVMCTGSSGFDHPCSYHIEVK